jgi:PAS domain S-box-containing protein
MPFLSESTHWMAIVLSPSGIITSVSGFTEQLTGYSAHELAGRPVACILGGETADEIHGFLRDAREWGSWAGEMIHKDRNGIPFPARATLARLTGSDDDCAGFVLISTDGLTGDDGVPGSTVHQISAHLREITHELNNPLAVVMGFTQLILLDSRCEGKMRKDLERVYAEMGRIIQIVEQLHGYAISLKSAREELKHPQSAR